MRLVHLAMQGFGAFRDRVDLDFDDVDFFAFVGPTGAGKSTVIDAVCFALYGTVPRYDDRRLVRHAITVGASEAKVSLTFELEGDRYVATRVVRRTPRGTVTTKEARLERGGDVLAGTERELSDEVGRLLGLGFEDFTRCVAIPQGEFAQFLRAKGDDRRGLMIRLLNLRVYERIGERARRLAAERAATVQAQQGRLDQLTHATDEAVRAARRRLDGLRSLQGQLDRDLAEVGELAERLRRAEEDVAAADAALAALAGVGVPEPARELGGRLVELAARLDAARADVERHEATRRRVEAARAALPPAAELQVALAAHDELAKVDDERLSLAAEAAGAATALAVAAEDLRRREDELAGAEEALEAARRLHAAHELAGVLRPGDDCPVCLRPVEVVPRHTAAPELDEARRARDAADGAAVEAALAEVTAAEGSERQARADEDRARAAVRDLEASHARLASASVELQATFDGQRDAVVHLGPPPAGGAGLLPAWEALSAWAAEQVPARETAREEAAGLVQRLGQDRRDRFTALRHALADNDVDAPERDEPTPFATAVAAALERATGDLDRLERDIAERARLEGGLGELRAEAQVADQLGVLLRSNAFPDWLVAEALELLAVDASAIVRELTGGRYSLANTDREFVVVDHANADEQRPARSLSGGETFQASLALALALAAQVRDLAAEGAPRLDAIFLDEGFGTLDAETLEVVADTIERLGASGRMVGIITHVRELAERVPVRFEVRKGHRTSSVEKVLV